MAISISLVGCELLSPKPQVKLPLNPVKNEQSDEILHELENKAPVLEASKELYPGTDRYVSNTAQKSRVTVVKGTGSASLSARLPPTD